jgi:hypothetical protein
MQDTLCTVRVVLWRDSATSDRGSFQVGNARLRMKFKGILVTCASARRRRSSTRKAPIVGKVAKIGADALQCWAEMGLALGSRLEM